MLGKNLPLSYFIHDQQICNSSFLGIPSLGTIGSIHVDTILLAFGCMATILLVAAFITPHLTSEDGGSGGQNFLELLYGFIEDITKGQIGSSYKYFLPLIASIFIFVLIANFVGVGPWKAFEGLSYWPKMPDGEPFELASPTTDFNVTFGLATISILTYLGSGFWTQGLKYIKAYLNPIEWLDLIIRPSTLALRLMMVITADELMRAAAIGMAPVFLPTGVMGFELFIGVIQAFVFALLTSIYIGLTVSHH
jgi:F-type H+-transporting ATPase subunit a